MYIRMGYGFLTSGNYLTANSLDNWQVALNVKKLICQITSFTNGFLVDNNFSKMCKVMAISFSVVFSQFLISIHVNHDFFVTPCTMIIVVLMMKVLSDCMSFFTTIKSGIIKKNQGFSLSNYCKTMCSLWSSSRRWYFSITGLLSRRQINY